MTLRLLSKRKDRWFEHLGSEALMNHAQPVEKAGERQIGWFCFVSIYAMVKMVFTHPISRFSYGIALEQCRKNIVCFPSDLHFAGHCSVESVRDQPGSQTDIAQQIWGSNTQIPSRDYCPTTLVKKKIHILDMLQYTVTDTHIYRPVFQWPMTIFYKAKLVQKWMDLGGSV